MTLSKTKRDSKMRAMRRILIGAILGAGTGYIASTLAGSNGSQCMILCNQSVAIPFFAAMGLLVAWR
jgi:hypothetical protein